MKTFEVRKPTEKDWAHEGSDFILSINETVSEKWSQRSTFGLSEAELLDLMQTASEGLENARRDAR